MVLIWQVLTVLYKKPYECISFCHTLRMMKLPCSYSVFSPHFHPTHPIYPRLLKLVIHEPEIAQKSVFPMSILKSMSFLKICISGQLQKLDCLHNFKFLASLWKGGRSWSISLQSAPVCQDLVTPGPFLQNTHFVVCLSSIKSYSLCKDKITVAMLYLCESFSYSDVEVKYFMYPCT